MHIESIKTYVKVLRDKILTRHYTTYVDDNNKKFRQVVDYNQTLYNSVGKTEPTENKGTKFDKKV